MVADEDDKMLPGDEESESGLCALLLHAILLIVIILVAAYAFVHPVRVTVSDASLSSFALNGTALAYDLSLAVSVHNPNWAMRAEFPAPLDADINFAGRRIGGARLVTAGRRSVERKKSDGIRLRAAAEVELGSDGVAALVKETTAGQLESLELKLSGKVRYRPVHLGSYRLAVTCPLRLPTTAAPGTNVVVVDDVIKCH